MSYLSQGISQTFQETWVSFDQSATSRKFFSFIFTTKLFIFIKIQISQASYYFKISLRSHIFIYFSLDLSLISSPLKLLISKENFWLFLSRYWIFKECKSKKKLEYLKEARKWRKETRRIEAVTGREIDMGVNQGFYK